MKRHVCSSETCGRRAEYDLKDGKRVNYAERLLKYGYRITEHGRDGRTVVRYYPPEAIRACTERTR